MPKDILPKGVIKGSLAHIMFITLSTYHVHNLNSLYRLPKKCTSIRRDKIGSLWLRMLRDNVGIKKLKNLDKVPIPVGIHVARATLAIGVVREKFNGSKQLIWICKKSLV